MDIALLLALAMALAFAFTNGFHDAANAIATLVATRVARPLPAVLMASFFNLLGPLLFGAAVANTISKIVRLPATMDPSEVIPVIGAGLTGAVIWNVYTWRKGLPSSSSHALIGGLVGASLLAAGVEAVNWGGMDGLRPVGVLGTLIALAGATVLSVLAALILERLFLRTARYLSHRATGPVRGAQWVTSAWLSFSHGSNDTMKTVGIIGALLLAGGVTNTFETPFIVILAASASLTVGTALGGWNIVRTIGKRIFPLRQLDGLASQAVSASIILAASGIGAPVSTTQVVAASVVGIGGGRRRWAHVDWAIVRHIGITWLTTMPAAGIIGAIALPLWRLL